jgi:hypothetical protein
VLLISLAAALVLVGVLADRITHLEVATIKVDLSQPTASDTAKHERVAKTLQDDHAVPEATAKNKVNQAAESLAAKNDALMIASALAESLGRVSASGGRLHRAWNAFRNQPSLPVAINTPAEPTEEELLAEALRALS